MASRHPNGRTVVVVGLGNIGSHLVPHLVRMGDIARVIVVDPGRYESSNVPAQAITPGEAGRGKVLVQAIRLRRIRPTLAVTSFGIPVEEVPLGQLRGDAILGCVDSRSARLYLNQASRHLGVPLIDAGVHADGMLARVSTFLPAADMACLECSWDQHDYGLVEQAYPCLPDQLPGAGAMPTGAPAELGALAASLQAIECRSLLDGRRMDPSGSREFIIDAHAMRAVESRHVRNPQCRLTDHEPWRVRRLDRLPENLTLREALAIGAASKGDAAGASLGIDGEPFVTGATCLGCGKTTAAMRLRRALTGRDRTCRSCGGRLASAAPQLRTALGHGEALDGAGDRTLRALGFEAGDIFFYRCGDEVSHYELAGN